MILPLDAYGGTFRLVDSVHKPAGITTPPPTSVTAASTPPGVTRPDWCGWRRRATPRCRSSTSPQPPRRPRAGWHLVVDNTFATPYLQNPLAFGADVVVHSTTKYLGGHSDVVGGLVALNDADVAARVAFLQNATGAVPGPWDCYLVQRGVKTLALRMERHCVNAQAVADFLEAHELVATTSTRPRPHPGHGMAKRQMRGFGGIVSFLHAGGEAEALAMVARTRVFTLAESLGAVESLIEHPARMTHAVLASRHWPSTQTGSSVGGIENIDDLFADLAQALDG